MNHFKDTIFNSQPTFRLTPTASHPFKYDPAMLTLEFTPEENQMILRQGGGEHVLTRE